MPQNDNKDTKQLSWSNPQNGQQSPKPEMPQPKVEAKTPAPHKAAVTSGPADRQGNGSAAKIAGWLAVGVIAGVIIAWGATGLYKHGATGDTTAGSFENATSTTGTTGSQAMSSDLLTVASPQKAGLEVGVSGVSVTEPTWVVVYESRQGKPGNVLGASLFFAGDTSGTIELLRATVAGQTYFVTERTDNGDHKFSLTDDPLVTTGGQPSWATFTAN